MNIWFRFVVLRPWWTIGTSVRTHILLSPDSLPPKRFHLKCSFEFYCSLLISTLTYPFVFRSTFHFAILLHINFLLILSIHNYPNLRFLDSGKYLEICENGCSVVRIYIFSSPLCQPHPSPWSEWSHLRNSTFSAEHKYISTKYKDLYKYVSTFVVLTILFLHTSPLQALLQLFCHPSCCASKHTRLS